MLRPEAFKQMDKSAAGRASLFMKILKKALKIFMKSEVKKGDQPAIIFLPKKTIG